MLKSLVDYIFPTRCHACNSLIEGSKGICSSCWLKLKFISKPYCVICCEKFAVSFEGIDTCVKCTIRKPKIDMIRSLLEFSPEAKGLIHNFKYNDKTILGKFFAELLYNRFSHDFQDVDIIAPVPMHKFKRIFRSYNPPQILASQLAKLMNKVAVPDLLIKKRLTKNQVGLNRAKRAQNLLDSFGLNKKFEVKDKVILLIDDVLTTGATSSECSKLLRKAKVSKVKLATIAKV